MFGRNPVNGSEGAEKCSVILLVVEKCILLSDKPKRTIYTTAGTLKKVLDGFYAWFKTVNPSQGTGLAKAVQYARNEKSYLYAFLEDPQIPIDNNLAERS